MIRSFKVLWVDITVIDVLHHWGFAVSLSERFTVSFHMRKFRMLDAKCGDCGKRLDYDNSVEFLGNFFCKGGCKSARAKMERNILIDKMDAATMRVFDKPSVKMIGYSLYDDNAVDAWCRERGSSTPRTPRRCGRHERVRWPSLLPEPQARTPEDERCRAKQCLPGSYSGSRSR